MLYITFGHSGIVAIYIYLVIYFNYYLQLIGITSISHPRTAGYPCVHEAPHQRMPPAMGAVNKEGEGGGSDIGNRQCTHAPPPGLGRIYSLYNRGYNAKSGSTISSCPIHYSPSMVVYRNYNMTNSCSGGR